MAVHRPTDTERGYVAGLSCLASEPILLIARVCRRNQRPQHSTTRSASANAICLVGVGPPRGAPATAVSGVVRSRHVPSLGLGRQRRRHLRSGDDRALLHLPRRPGRRPPTPARRRRGTLLLTGMTPRITRLLSLTGLEGVLLTTTGSDRNVVRDPSNVPARRRSALHPIVRPA
jgi:hypothetical protein